jgi:hypothetical protein
MTTTPRPTTDDDAYDRIITIFDRLMHRLMATHAPELSAIDLTMAQTKALYIVLAAGRLRMSELAARLGVTSSTATGQVDRQVVVTGTDRAEATVEQFRELNSLRMREMLANVAARDLPTVERALRILEAAVPEPTDPEAAPAPPPPAPTQHEGPNQ